MLLPVGGIALVGFLVGFADFQAKVIFGEGGHHGDFFVIHQGGGFVGGFAKLGGIEESLRIGEQVVVAIELLVLGEGHGVVLGHEVFGEVELCFEDPIGGIYQVNFTG